VLIGFSSARPTNKALAEPRQVRLAEIRRDRPHPPGGHVRRPEKNVSSPVRRALISTGVPKIMVVEIKLKVSSPNRISKGNRDPCRPTAEPSAPGSDMSLEFGVQLDQFGIGGGLALTMQALQQMPAPFGED